MENVISIIISLLIITFLMSSLPKIVYLKDFMELVLNYKVLPDFLSRIVAFIIPIAELTAVYLLLSEKTVILGIVLICSLLTSFHYAVSKVLKEDRKIYCGCFGKFMDSIADRFTLVKIKTYLAISLTTGTIIFLYTPSLELNISNVSFGTFLALVLLILQKTWSAHQDVNIRLKKEEELKNG